MSLIELEKKIKEHKVTKGIRDENQSHHYYKQGYTLV